MKFGSNPSSPRASSVDTLIGAHTQLIGDVTFAGGLHLDGRIQGDVVAVAGKHTHLSISDTGSVDGQVKASAVVLNGSVTGDVHSTEKLTLGSKARVLGNVFYKVLEIQAGAQVNGQMVHESMAALATLTHRPAALAELPDGSNMMSEHDGQDRPSADAMN